MSHSDEQWQRIEKLLSDMEDRVGRKLTDAEKRLMKHLTDALAFAVKNGQVNQDPNISKVIDDVFDNFIKNELRPIAELLAQEIVKTVSAINKYFQLQVSGTVLSAKAASAGTVILKSFGIEQDDRSFRLKLGGYLDNLIKDNTLRNMVRKSVFDAAFGRINFSDMMTTVGKLVEGSASVESQLQRHFKTMAIDVVNIAARSQEDMIADSLGMQAFIFTGTVIDKTRPFCRDNAGDVILVSEALEQWPKLRNEKNGPQWDKDLEYKPLEHMGGHRCRHHKRYITNQEAVRRDKTLRIVGKELKRAA